MDLLTILLIVDAGLLALVLIFAIIRFCVVNAKKNAEEVPETEVKEEKPEQTEESAKKSEAAEEAIPEGTEKTEPVKEETEKPQEEIKEQSPYVDETMITIPRIKVRLIESADSREIVEREERELKPEPKAYDAQVVNETEEAFSVPAESATEQPAKNSETANEESIAEESEFGAETENEPVEKSVEESFEENDELVIGGANSLEIDAKRIPFKEKLLGAEEKVQDFYNELYNKFISYRKMHPRVSAKGVSFRFGRELVAKITYRGKTMKLHLALDVNAFDENIYFQRDMSDVKAYAEVPFTVKVKSERGLKRAMELIEALVVAKGIEAKTRYEKTDAVAELKALD